MATSKISGMGSASALTGAELVELVQAGANVKGLISAISAYIVAQVVAGAPAALDTLDELSAAIGDDPAFAATVAASLALKAPLASPALTGAPTAPTPSGGDSDTSIATTAFVQGELTAKAPLDSPALTGSPTAPTPSVSDSDTSIATTAFVQGEFAARSGSVIGSTIGTYATNADITAQIPWDDTIPQNTEGTEIISVSHTPKTTTNKLRIRFAGVASLSGGAHAPVALFIGAAADAVAASYGTAAAANGAVPLALSHEYTPGAITAQTIAIRVGPGAAVTMRMNGTTTVRKFGGVMKATLVVEEIQA